MEITLRFEKNTDDSKPDLNKPILFIRRYVFLDGTYSPNLLCMGNYVNDGYGVEWENDADCDEDGTSRTIPNDQVTYWAYEPDLENIDVA